MMKKYTETSRTLKSASDCTPSPTNSSPLPKRRCARKVLMLPSPVPLHRMTATRPDLSYRTQLLALSAFFSAAIISWAAHWKDGA